MSAPEWTRVSLTKRQASLMANALWRLQSSADAYFATPVKDQQMLAELRRRLHLAAIGRP